MNIVEYKGWTKNIRLTNENVELVITLDIGPRIIRYGFIGEENILGEVSEQLGKSQEEEWKIRGGHRLWIAPESKGVSYEPDNEPVYYEEIQEGIRVVQEPGRLSGIQKMIEITLSQDNRVTIRHIIKNTTDEMLRYAVWPITVMHKGGDVIIPLPKKDPFGQHSDVPNQIWSIWSFSDLSGKRFNIEERYVRIINRAGCCPFKIGILNREGWVAYHKDQYVFIKRFPYSVDKTYPDGNVNFEVYMDNSIVELETLGPLIEIQPGQSIRHDEDWGLYKDVDTFDHFIAL